MSNLTLNTTHPFNNREQTYFMDRKLISVHSIDRDINKWPNANEFEILLPQSLNNVYALRLVSINIPNNIIPFTNSYQNTKMKISISHDISGAPTAESDAIDAFYSYDANTTVTINDGIYTPDELAKELEYQLNAAVSKDLNLTYDKFIVKYDKTRYKFIFINTRDNFVFDTYKRITYTDVPCGQKNVWFNYANWGLPYNLGFRRNAGYPTIEVDELNFAYDSTTYLPSSDSSYNTVKYLESHDFIDINIPDCVYMELDKYNSIDELYPYSDSTSSTYNNDYSGKNNSAFAKIPLLKLPYNSMNDIKDNITFFKLPIQRISKLKFKFRFHDGRLVDFYNMPFSFTIEAHELIDEQRRSYSVNQPSIYIS